MISIELIENQTGYDAVGEYIFRYWKRHLTDDVIVRIGKSFDGVSYDIRNEFASPYGINDIMFASDWWEGERFISLYGIKLVNDVDVIDGIYDK